MPERGSSSHSAIERTWFCTAAVSELRLLTVRVHYTPQGLLNMEGGRVSFAAERKQRFEDMTRLAATKSPEELVLTYKGVQYPALLCSQQTFEALHSSFRPRSDDARLIAYPKCGFNWAMQLLKSMVCMVNKEVEEHIERMIPVLEFGKPDKYKAMEEFPSPRAYGTHLNYDDLPKSFFDNKRKMLVIFRNPKDTAVSYFHFYNKNPVLPSFNSWDEFFPRFMSGEVMWGSYFDHAIAWNKHMDEPNVLLMTFEELKEDLTAGAKKIADFFDFPLTEEQIQSVAEGGSFTAMQETYKATSSPFAQVFLRKGEVGDWKNLFSEAQSQEMDAKYEECLAGTALGNKLKYDVYCKF